MKTQPPPGRPGEQVKEVSLILTEGQREEGIEVLQIDERAGSVKVNNSGTVMTLTFDKDGPKLQNPPPGGVPPPLPPPGGAPTRQMAAPLSPTGIPNAAPNRYSAGPDPRILPNASGAGTATVNGAMNPGGTAPAIAGVSPSTPNQTTPAANQGADLTPEEQAIIIELQREANKDNPNYPPYPPTALTPAQAQGTTGTDQAGTAVPGPGIPPVNAANRPLRVVPQ